MLVAGVFSLLLFKNIFSAGSSNKLHQPTLHRSKPTLNRDVEGELSTIIGASVKVTADGVVHVNRANGAEER